MIEGYVFDFDGTLADSMPTWSQGMMNVIQKSGVAYPDNIIEILTPLGDKKGTEYLKNVLKIPFSLENMRKMLVDYTTPLYLEKVMAKDGVIEYVKNLKKQNKKIAVLTASAHSRIDGCLKRWGIYDDFDLVRTCDDYEKSKADKTIYDDICRELGLDKDKTAFFDDNLEVVRTVKSAGLFAVGVYDYSGRAFTDKMKESSDLFVQNIGDAGIL